jgi:hypothetical protein
VRVPNHLKRAAKRSRRRAFQSTRKSAVDPPLARALGYFGFPRRAFQSTRKSKNRYGIYLNPQPETGMVST